MGIALLAIGYGISVLRPYHRFFLERDPALSFPYIGTAEEVPIWLLALVSYVVPTLIIIGTQILHSLVHTRTQSRIESPISSYTNYYLMPHIGMAESLGYAVFLTTILKIFVGRPRPNFFAYCNYKGYRDALFSGNFTSYNAQTIPGAIGSIAFCLETNQTFLDDSQFSFPSGHSSTAFAGLTFFAFYLFHVTPKFYKLKQSNIRILPINVAILMILVIADSFIAATRTRDYYHNFDDILGGALLGFGCACFVFWVNYQRLKMPDPTTEVANNKEV